MRRLKAVAVVLVALSSLAGCGDNGGVDCSPGLETCPCQEGRCLEGLQCLSGLCVMPGGTGGAGGDGGMGGTAGVGGIGGSTPTTCDLAANGWPSGQAPAGYPNGAPEGFSVGDQLPLRPINDQNGNTDISLSQFYGRMVVLVISAVWDPVSTFVAGDILFTQSTLEDSLDVVIWPIFLLLEGPLVGEPSLLVDARNWADTYGLSSPVAWGLPATDIIADSTLGSSLPTFVIADPEFRVRNVTEGYPGEEAFRESIADAFDAFEADNPTWTSPCVDN